MKKIVTFYFLLVTLGLSGQTLVQKFYLDFGQDNPNEERRTTGVDANSNYWNNLVAPNGSPSTLDAGIAVALKNAENTTTAYVVEVARTIRSNGGANGGLATPDPALLGDLAVGTATEDYFFLDGGMGKGLFKFKNLDTAKAYKFYIYGCRTAAGNQRGVIYSLSGKNGSHGKQLNSGTGIGADGYDGNNHNVWESTLVVPAGNGEIMLELGRLFSGEMAYINALKMEEYSDFTLPVAEKRFYIDFGMNNNGLDGSPTVSPDANSNYWNNLGPAEGVNGPTNQVAVDTNISLVASDNTTTGYILETGSVMEWNGVRNGSLGGTDSPDEPTALLGDLAIKTATYDYLFINNGATAVLKFKNLDRTKQYRFNIFGSRKDDSNEGRTGRIEIAGTNTVTGIHQMGGAGIGANNESYNNKNIFVSDLIIPDAGNVITLTMTCWLGMSYINCIKLEELAGENLPDATGISFVSGDNSITQCGHSIQLTVAALPQGALLPTITWSIDNEQLAHITETGRLYAKANGSVTLTATATLKNGEIVSLNREIIILGQNIGDYSFTVMGSSIPWGEGAAPRDVNGYAWKWTNYLQNNAINTWTTNNISIGGNNTQNIIDRWNKDLFPSCSRYVYYGLSLGNEGVHERGEAAFVSWRNNMLQLIERTRKHDKIPIVGNNYPHGDFNSTDYAFVKQLNLLIHEWDVPSVNLLGAIDNGAGQWASGHIADNAHPNTAGHAEMFYAVVPSLLDAIAAGKPQPVRNQTASLALTKGTRAQSITFIPEDTLHSFTLTFSFKTNDAGTIASFITQGGDTVLLQINTQGKLAYKTYSTTPVRESSVVVNDGQWHTVSLTHYYAWGNTLFYLDGVKVNTRSILEKQVPVKFYINAFEDAPQQIEYRELFFHRAGMCTEEIQALYQGKMLKSSLEIYAPLNGDASEEQGIVNNLAQSLNTLALEERKMPCAIGNFEDLNTLLRNDLTSSYYLTDDIEIPEGTEWVPIGASSVTDNEPQQFKGTFDGCGYSIKNLKITTAGNFKGLFGRLYHATVRDLSLDNVDITGLAPTGALTGAMIGESLIERVSVSGTVSGGTEIGGIVGRVARDPSYPGYNLIRDCYVTADITATKRTTDMNAPSVAGGIAAFSHGDSGGNTGKIDIRRCYVSGAVISQENANIAGNAAGILAFYDNHNFVKMEEVIVLCDTIGAGTSNLFFSRRGPSYNQFELFDKVYARTGIILNYLNPNDKGRGAEIPEDIINYFPAATYKTQQFYDDNMSWDFDNIWTITEGEYPKLKKRNELPTSWVESKIAPEYQIVAERNGINIRFSGDFSASLFDMTGRIIYEKSAYNQLFIPVKKGIYIVKIGGKTNTYSGKMVVM